MNDITTTNKDFFLKTIAHEIEVLTSTFNFDYHCFNTDGCVGYQFNIETHTKDGSNTIYVWFNDEENNNIYPEDFKIEDLSSYTMHFQASLLDGVFIKERDSLEEICTVYKDFINETFGGETVYHYLK